MLIEIHMIQNHSPANLNRDDLGAPKSCIFGGVPRARISSQCLKRSIRRSAEFQLALERSKQSPAAGGGGGVRTRKLISELAEKASGPNPPEGLVELVKKAVEKGGLTVKNSGEDPNATDILIYVPQSTLEKMAHEVKKFWESGDRDADRLAERLADPLGEPARAPDIALWGRMLELRPNGKFAGIDFRVEAAMQVAHAISTHEVISEVDYFTAVDDLGKSGEGAGHVNEAMFNSACFYKYFCLNLDQLKKNLGGCERNPGEAGRCECEVCKLAAETLGHFLRAAALTTPSGKQNSFAASNLPDGILVEIKRDCAIPTNYANAFVEPVNPKSERGLVGQSVAQLAHYVHQIDDGYGLKPTRFWFSPAMRYPFECVDSDAKPKEGKPVVEPQAHNVDRLDDLVKSVVEEATKDVAANGKTEA